MPKGGKRNGSGRPKGMGPRGETTKPMRIPLSMQSEIADYLDNRGYQIPLYAAKVSAGTPSSVADDIDGYFTLNSMLIKNPKDSFFLPVTGDSMINAGILEGDTLIVDRSLAAENGKIVVAFIDNQATVKRLRKDKSGVFLMPENDNYPPIKISKFNDLNIAGVVVGVVRRTI